ncbi:spore photoproduct lyase [Effusibacillus dendaii]|uniref:Spore photoproduct lyase n=1 Tax=Effusibacillus dendaii TaxID=2743772 RepID=A0A7I8D8R3_9BACL|nr:spore photoproduct lyase [Effusibacillus dendaii]BCJ86514.1 spore photoproduct lyase [Effusibacillus dendaii]
MATIGEKPLALPKTKPFMPDLVFFEPKALDYEMGDRLYRQFKEMGTPIKITPSHNRVVGIPGDTPQQAYRNAKNTLVVGIKKSMDLEQSKPSADYSLPPSTGCMGHCHYCYLQTTMGKKPYVRVYVNIDEILATAKKYIERRAPNITTFEAACSSDPVGVEHLTGSLHKMIEFFGQEELGRLRFVTKYANVDSLLDARHNQHTRFRFSVNSEYVIRNFEPATSHFQERVEAAGKVARAGFPLGFIVAPLMVYKGWQEGYEKLFRTLADTLIQEAKKDLTFELIQHRFTPTAKKVILERYPKTKLEMEEEKRKYKWGKYGRGKYVYPDEQARDLDETIRHYIATYFPEAVVQYFT